MRDIIEKIVAGDNDRFADLMNAVVGGKVLVFAEPEDEEGLTINFLNYTLEEEDLTYIPIFSDHDEVNEFLEDDDDVPEGYALYEFEGELLADLVDMTQYVMVNPATGGIVFQGAHLKAVLGGVDLDELMAQEDDEEDDA